MNEPSPFSTHQNGGSPAAERDGSGRFAPGWRGGPGRPKRSTETAYLAAISEACPLGRWLEIVGKAVEQAAEGDATARAFLASYLLGKPIEQPVALGAAVRIADAVDEAIGEIKARRDRRLSPEAAARAAVERVAGRRQRSGTTMD